MKLLRVAIYLRVSTQDQSLELQRSELVEFVVRRGWELVGTYEDKATGTNENRPQLKQLMSDARERKFDCLVIWKLDRLFRSLKGLVLTIQDFQALGISFVSLKDQIDLTTPSGRLMVHMLASFAEFEASLIRERVVAGLVQAKKNGVRLGRPPTLNDREMRRLRDNGYSVGSIARMLNCSKGGVHKSLTRTSPLCK